jgi:pimeloyl-ACP methyl ester carboxylesterase
MREYKKVSGADVTARAANLSSLNDGQAEAPAYAPEPGARLFPLALSILAIKQIGYWRLLAEMSVSLSLFLLLTIVPAMVIAPEPPAWAPSFLQTWAFDVRLTIAPSLLKLSSIRNGRIGDNRLYLDSQGETLSFTNQEVRLVGTVYRPPQAESRPGILLLHGSTPEGRRLGLYRVLGKELAERGYVVLAIDQRGFGESSNPPQVDRVEAFDWTGDIGAAISYLASLEDVDPERLHILGHSMGANRAISVGIEDERIQRIVAIGPGRRVHERAEKSADYFRRRQMRYMRLPRPIPARVYEDILENTLFIENHMTYFTRPGHKPILLLDGALESKADRQFLREICAEMVEPKRCHTLKNADHYANVINVGRVVIYDQPVLDALVGQIDSWLRKDEQKCCKVTGQPTVQIGIAMILTLEL